MCLHAEGGLPKSFNDPPCGCDFPIHVCRRDSVAAEDRAGAFKIAPSNPEGFCREATAQDRDGNLKRGCQRGHGGPTGLPGIPD